MFCDLVGSTELSGRLDPEDMGRVIRVYQNVCAEVVERWGGHVAKYMGDGVLAYFGWPGAHEDDAERAVRAGLELVEAVRALDAPGFASGCGREARQPLAARVGIATGLVMVGELIGEGAAQEETVVGETPNLAGRLQALATPGSVVISQATRRLLGGLFELTDLGPQRLKGFAEPLAAFRVEGEGRAEGRFEALHGERLTPLVGREHELGILLERWAWARDGDGQVVLLSGEPGIGKSRVMRALRERLGDEPYTPLSHYCSPYHTNSALYPVIGLLERAARFERDEPPEQQLAKLEALLAPSSDRPDEVVPLLAALLGIPTGERYPAPTLTPEVQKRRTLQALVDQLAALAAQQPMLVLYEDVHWADPSTLELLGLVIERIPHLRVLALITFRPEFQPPWTGHAHVTTLAMGRLGRRQGADLIARVTGDKPLPPTIVEQIVARTDGVPLFVEELTKTVLESGLLADAGDHYELSGPLPPLAIPATLHDSLMARLDRLAPVKEVAQIGAVIGREFSHELLAAVAPMSANQLGEALEQLVQSELVFRRGTPPDAIYSFKHALVQDAAYSTLLRGRRQELHARIAQALEERFPETAASMPELLAHHCTEAGLAKTAIEYWLRAGRQAISRSANLEAVAQFRKGLSLLQILPDDPVCRQNELDLQVGLGEALIAAKGWSASEVPQVYQRARQLCEQLQQTSQLLAVLYGLFAYYHVRGEADRALEVASDLLNYAQRRSDPTGLLMGYKAVGLALFCHGKLKTARQHMEAALGHYNSAPAHSHAFLSPQYHRATVLAWLSLNLMTLGCVNEAVQRSQESLSEVSKTDMPLAQTYCLSVASRLRYMLQDFQTLEEYTATLLILATETGLPYSIANGKLYRGWLLTHSGIADEGIALVLQCLTTLRAMGAGLQLSYSLAVTADAFQKTGRIADGLSLLDEGLRQVDESGVRWCEAELYRVKGQLLLRQDHERDAAERCLCKALAIARQQDAKFWELRAATSLARLWTDQGRRAEARDLLAPVYGWFTEGFDTQDLEDAKALIEELL